MGETYFFKKVNQVIKNKDALYMNDQTLKPIVELLTSSNEDNFWTGIEVACQLSEQSSNKGVLAIQEAIIRKSASQNCKFYDPTITGRSITEYQNSGADILEISENNSLLKDTYKSGSLISAFNSFCSSKEVEELSENIKTIGGVEQYLAFTLLYNLMWCSVQVNKHK
ncbi:hypothetical protein ACFLZ5_05570 [Thermodesulfobacteriota bacterium]